jgi:hypothetical protein
MRIETNILNMQKFKNIITYENLDFKKKKKKILVLKNCFKHSDASLSLQ